MKTRSFLFFLLSFFLCMCSSDSVRVQSVQVEGKPMQIVSQRTLSPQMKYLLLQETANAPAKAFLETNKGLKPTVFSESELLAFLASRKLEDLGKVMTLQQPGNASIRYVVKGKTNVFVLTANNQLDFFEYEGPVRDVINSPESWLSRSFDTGFLPGSGFDNNMGSKQDGCIGDCIRTFEQCVKDIGNAPTAIFTGRYKDCENTKKGCIGKCVRDNPTPPAQ